MYIFIITVISDGDMNKRTIIYYRIRKYLNKYSRNFKIIVGGIGKS